MRGGLLAAVAAVAMISGGALHAQPAAEMPTEGDATETLREALVETYARNPTLMAARAQVRARPLE